MNTPARHLRPVSTAWQATDPVLAALRAARDRRDQADRDIRILLAYARELATPRPYRLADLAQATGKSISGTRTGYTPADIHTARRIVHQIGDAQAAAEHPKDGSHD
jgi:AraC-like DNA-binding protein